jgi:hypothetical protein
MTTKLRLDSFFNDIQIGVRNSVLPTVHNFIRPQTRMRQDSYKVTETKIRSRTYYFVNHVQGDQQENKSRVLPHLLFYQNVCLLIVAKLSLPCTVVLLVVYLPRFESNILIKMISLQW